MLDFCSSVTRNSLSFPAAVFSSSIFRVLLISSRCFSLTAAAAARKSIC